MLQKPIFLGLSKTVSEEMIPRVKEVYGFLESFLQNKEWLAGDHATLADIQCVTTATSLNFVVPIENTAFPNMTQWISKCQQLHYYGPNKIGLEKFKAMVEMLQNRIA